MREPSRRAQDRVSTRALALCAALAGAGGAAGCSNLLGIEDPTPAFGGDGGPKTLTALAIEPSPLNLPLGVTRQLRATGMFDDGSSDDLTEQVQFALASGNTLTVSPTGLVTAIAQGESTVTASLGRVTGNAVATVGVAVPERLTISLGDFTIARQQSVRLRAIAVLTDGTMRDETQNASYATDNQAVATVGAPGRVDAGTTAGMATISASLAGAMPGTVKVTVAPRNCHPVINELQTGSDANPAEEWVEVLNPCTAAIDMTGWTLVYRSASATGALDSVLLYTFAGSLGPGELRLYAGEGYNGARDGGWTGMSGQLQQNSAAVGLRSGAASTGPLVDSVAYGAVSAANPFIEGTALGAMSNNKSAQRRPFDGNDQDQNSTDFTIVDTPTPRAPNVP